MIHVENKIFIILPYIKKIISQKNLFWVELRNLNFYIEKEKQEFKII